MIWPKNDSVIVGSLNIEIPSARCGQLFQIVDQVDHCLRDNLGTLDELTIYTDSK